MINTIFKGIIGFINLCLSPILTGIDNIITLIFPNFNIGSNVSNFLYYFDEIASYMLFPISWLPTSFISCLRSIIQLEFIWITGQIAYRSLIKIFRIIKNVKIW